ncbi:MAG: ATP-binding cassette domain-containing protein [Marinosulfonomonas sp.]|nr:ATP-binding cassette domain-containing protein [Marinosulfonomonas sp.]
MAGKKQPDKEPDIGALIRAKKAYFFRKISRDGARKVLRSVIDPDVEKEQKQPKIQDDGALLATCQVIGQEEHIQFKPALPSMPAAWGGLKKILRASEVMSLAVELTGQWEKTDHGHLLGFLKADNTPVALLWRGSHYQMVNVKTGKTVNVNRQLADEIESGAHSFSSTFSKEPLNAWKLIKYMLKFTKRDVIYFFSFGLLAALLSLAIPISAGYIFNTIIPGGELGDLYQIGGLIIILVAVLGVIEFTRSMAVLRFEGRASYKLQTAVLDRVLHLKAPFFSKYDAGNLAERVLSVEKIRTILSANIMGAIISLIFSIFYLFLMIYYDWQLALLALVLGSVVAGFTLSISLLAYKHVAGYMRMSAIISGFMMMIMGGMQKIRLTNTGDKVYNIWADKFAQQNVHYANKRKLLIVADIFTFAFPIIASLLIYIRIHTLLLDAGSDFQIGDFIAFHTAYLFFQGALINAFMVTVPAMSIKPAYEMLLPILKADMEDTKDKQYLADYQGGIEINSLNFRYADSPDLVLKNVSFTVQPGEFVALVGGSGSGKSTLLRVLLGFEDHESGSILYDGVNSDDIDIRSFRDQVGIVLQNGKILQGTVLFNIIGTSNYSKEEAWAAARMAGCEADIKALAHGMDTMLPPGGGILSGGQKQRLLIARALVKKPKLLLFDEATSALDNESQTTVSQSVNNLQATRIVIAHRLSTIKSADKVIVLEDGKIVEQGKYRDLIQQQGYFYDLVKTQLS